MTGSVERILIADDEPQVRAALREFITDLGYITETASNGTEALVAVLQHRPDLVFLDIKMPGMDGLETLRRIREIDSTIPVIMVTGDADIPHIGKALTSGAFGYIPKPVDLDYLEHLVAAVLQPKRPAHGSQ